MADGCALTVWAPCQWAVRGRRPKILGRERSLSRSPVPRGLLEKEAVISPGVLCGHSGVGCTKTSVNHHRIGSNVLVSHSRTAAEMMSLVREGAIVGRTPQAEVPPCTHNAFQWSPVTLPAVRHTCRCPSPLFLFPDTCKGEQTPPKSPAAVCPACGVTLGEAHSHVPVLPGHRSLKAGCMHEPRHKGLSLR